MRRMNKGDGMDQNKINEALDFLNIQSKEKREEIAGLINEKYSNVKEMMAGGEKKAKEMATEVDLIVRENPWMSVGVAAAGGFLLAYLTGAACKRTGR